MAIESLHPATSNPYAPPKAAVGDLASGAGQEAVFFAVSCTKLALMSLATFGLYQLYWSYKNWQCVARLNDEKLNAPIRAFFYTLTSYYLFRKLEERAAS